jgi:exopolyphosphatase/pppGpp-phosphohydrolase
LKGSSNPRQKAACRFLLDLPVPPSWSHEEWELLAWTVRYHRGAEPKVKNNAFARLSAEQQGNVRALAGLIRLARGLRKCGVETCVGLRAENAEEAIVLHVPGLVDSIDNAARVAKAKHLLETSLGKPIIVKTIQPAEKVVPLPQEPQLRVAAAASD